MKKAIGVAMIVLEIVVAAAILAHQPGFWEIVTIIIIGCVLSVFVFGWLYLALWLIEDDPK